MTVNSDSTTKASFLPSLTREKLSYYWVTLAILCLLISGVFAFLITAARVPGLASFFSQIDFFKRALIVHVDLAVAVWFTAFPISFFHLSNQSIKISFLSKLCLSLSVAGIILMIITGFSPLGDPYLSNYIPVVSHPLFLTGLILYFSGIFLSYWDVGFLFSPPDQQNIKTFSGSTSHLDQSIPLVNFGIRVGALYFIISIITLIVSSFSVPSGLKGDTHYELAMWGGGHLLQFSNVSFMLVSWVLLLTSWLKTPPLTRKQLFIVFLWLSLPILTVPFIAVQEATARLHRDAFTFLMRWGIFPPVSLFIFWSLKSIIKKPSHLPWMDVRFLTFAFSALLIVSGFIFGSQVRGPDLRLPGHYHASIGAVTLAFMGVAFVLLDGLGKLTSSLYTQKKSLLNAIFYGIGQMLFSGGMFIAGVYGMARKTYGVEQQIKNSGQTAGMIIMAIGGVIVLIGGFIYSVIMAKKLLSKEPTSLTQSTQTQKVSKDTPPN